MFQLSADQLEKGFKTEHYILGVDKRHMRLDPSKYGFADITFTCSGETWVWEVKSATYDGRLPRPLCTSRG